MIESLNLAGQAAFGPADKAFGPLSKINFVFGPNGSGKTSISRQFSGIAGRSDLAAWRDTERLEVRVFNRDYVERTFTQDRDLPGVFVLGEQSAEAIAERDRLSDERIELRAKVTSLSNALGSRGESGSAGSGKRGELAAVDDTLANAAWEEKQALAGTFKEFFTGFNASRAALLAEVLRVRKTAADDVTSSAGQIPDGHTGDDGIRTDVTALSERLKVLLDKQAGDLALVETPGAFREGQVPNSDLLAKPIVGRSDVAVASLIERLGNSDWVAEGQVHAADSGGLCPFCQQLLPEGFLAQLLEYFDRGFENDIAALRLYQAEVETFLGGMASIVAAIDGLPEGLVRDGRSSTLARDVDHLARQIREVVATKVASPATVMTLPETSDIVDAVVDAATTANDAIRLRLALIADRESALLELRSEVWSVLVDERLSTALDVYDAARGPLVKAVLGLEEGIAQAQRRLREVETEIREVSRRTISSAPVIDRINSMLDAVGFTNFKLAPSEQVEDGYRLQRDSGEVVGHTLSEGERSFITFLYFASQIEGVHPEEGLAEDATVVIDDPISSLDSEALFFVSTYLRGLISKVASAEGQSSIKQVTVLTHNVYFHKELTYNIEKVCGGKNIRYFGIVKRRSDGNLVTPHDSNPITTAYAGLWQQVKLAREGQDVPSVQNAMRRIIESYFQFVGDPLLGDLPSRFEGTDRMVCRSLISWVHDGSHATSVLDAVDYSHAGGTSLRWLEVFERLFEVSGHSAHFEAMTR